MCLRPISRPNWQAVVCLRPISRPNWQAVVCLRPISRPNWQAVVCLRPISRPNLQAVVSVKFIFGGSPLFIPFPWLIGSNLGSGLVVHGLCWVCLCSVSDPSSCCGSLFSMPRFVHEMGPRELQCC